MEFRTCMLSLVCVMVKWGESGYFRIEGGVRQGCFMCPWFFNVYMYAVLKEMKMGMGRIGVRVLKEGRM